MTIDAELLLRKEWWANHPNQYGSICCPYGDDGEMQCCGVDFRRAPLERLQSWIEDARLRAMLRRPADDCACRTTACGHLASQHSIGGVCVICHKACWS